MAQALNGMSDRLEGNAGDDQDLSDRARPRQTPPQAHPNRSSRTLKRMRDLGCEYAILNFPEAAYDRSGIELFEQKVIPAVS